jgi:protease I
VDDGFEQVELVETRKALEEGGATTEIVSPQPEVVKAWNHSDWGDKFQVDITVESADPTKYDALLLPGGVMNPDKLRHNSKVLQFVSSFAKHKKPIAAICHAPWTLIDAGFAVVHWRNWISPWAIVLERVEHPYSVGSPYHIAQTSKATHL